MTGPSKPGWYRPADIRSSSATALDPALVEGLRAIPGLSSTVSDVLDALGYRLSLPGSEIARVAGPGEAPLIGRVVTLRYLPLRAALGPDEANGRLAYGTAFDLAEPGDVIVISAPRGLAVSVLGGKAMAAGQAAGIAGAIADGSVRDVDELDAVGLPVWATGVTPVSGRGRLEAIALNGPVEIRGVHVVPGDVAVADGSGVVFVPADQFEAVATQILGDR